MPRSTYLYHLRIGALPAVRQLCDHVQLAVFDLCGVSLLHGWIADASESLAMKKLSKMSYNQATLAVVGQLDDDPALVASLRSSLSTSARMKLAGRYASINQMSCYVLELHWQLCSAGVGRAVWHSLMEPQQQPLSMQLLLPRQSLMHHQYQMGRKDRLVRSQVPVQMSRTLRTWLQRLWIECQLQENTECL